MNVYKRRTWLACGVCLFVAFLTAGCVGTQQPEFRAKDTLTIGVPEGIVAGTDLGLQSLISTLSLEGLTFQDEDGRALPRLAESWDWEREGLRLRVSVRHNVILHDGTALSSALAAEMLREAIARPQNRMLFTSLQAVSSVADAGDGTLTIDLKEPAAFLPEDLELPLSKGPNRVGTGPYRVTERDASGTVLQRFDRYYAGVPSIREVTIRPFGPLRTAWASLLRGELDMVTSVPPEAVEFIRNDQVDVISHLRRYQYLMGFNSARPPFNVPAVRRALNHAVDRSALIQRVLKGQGAPSTGPLWPRHWAYDTTVSPFSYDPQLAISLLEQARVQPVQANDGRKVRLRFRCLIPAEFSLVERVALELQRQLYLIGVDVQFDVVPIEEFDRRVREGSFEAMLIEMVSGPSLGRAYLFWASAKQFRGLNVFGFENADAERLFGVLRTSTNEAAVRSATRNLQRVFLEDPPALFLAWSERARAVRREFQVVREQGGDPVSTIWRWTPATPQSVQRR